jgi:hypothetical protein
MLLRSYKFETGRSLHAGYVEISAGEISAGEISAGRFQPGDFSRGDFSRQKRRATSVI